MIKTSCSTGSFPIWGVRATRSFKAVEIGRVRLADRRTIFRDLIGLGESKMEIHGPGRIDGPQSIKAPHRVRSVESQAPTENVQGLDQVDISPEADLVRQVQDAADVRTDRIAEIRAQIEAGVYETDEKN